MSRMAAKFVSASSPEELRRTFEAGISKTQGRIPSTPSRRPIFVRSGKTMTDEHAEKLALTDAARALAQLWKISPTLVR